MHHQQKSTLIAESRVLSFILQVLLLYWVINFFKRFKFAKFHKIKTK